MNIFGILAGEMTDLLNFIKPIQLQLVALAFMLVLEFMYFHRRRLPILSTRTFIGILIFSLVFIIADTSVILVSKLHLPRNWGMRLASQIRLYAYLNFSLCQYLYISFLQGRQQHIKVIDGIKIFSIYAFGVLSIISVNFLTKNEQQGLFAYDVINLINNIISLFYAFMTIIESRIFYKKRTKNPTQYEAR